MTICTRPVRTAEAAQAVLDEVVERNHGLNSTPEAGPLVAIPGGFTASLRWGEHGGGDLVVIPSEIRHWHVTNAAGDVVALAASRADGCEIAHRDVRPAGRVHTCWAVDPCDLRPCLTCARVAGHFRGCPDGPEAVELRYVVRATFRGEPVYVSTRARDDSQTLVLAGTPTAYTVEQARHLADLARANDSLSHVVVDQDPDTTGLTLDTVITGTAWRGTVRQAIQATQPDVFGTLVQTMERLGRLPETDDEVDPRDVLAHMNLDDVRMLLDDPGARIAGAAL